MLTERELKAVSQVFRLAVFLYIIPFDWDAQNGRMQATKSALKNVISIMCTSLTWTYFFFKCYRLKDMMATPNWKSDWTVFFVYQVCFLTVSCIHTNNHFLNDGIANVFNNLVDFNKREGTRYLGKEFEEPCRRDYASMAFIGSFVNFFLCLMLFFLVYPTKHMFFYSMVPEENASLTIFIVFFIIEWVACFNMIITYTVYILIQYCYLVSMKFWLRRICILWPATQRTGVLPATVPNLLSLFRKAQLLNREYNRSYAGMLTPIVITTMFSLAVGCCFTTLRFVHAVPVVMSLINVGMFFMAQLQLIIGTTLVAALHELSGSCKMNFKEFVKQQENFSTKERKQWFRCIDACRPFGFQVGSLYVIKQDTKATLFNLLINTICNLLLAF